MVQAAGGRERSARRRPILESAVVRGAIAGRAASIRHGHSRLGRGSGPDLFPALALVPAQELPLALMHAP